MSESKVEILTVFKTVGKHRSVNEKIDKKEVEWIFMPKEKLVEIIPVY